MIIAVWGFIISNVFGDAQCHQRTCPVNTQNICKTPGRIKQDSWTLSLLAKRTVSSLNGFSKNLYINLIKTRRG